ncbi:MAG: tetratricopeptide repeat protein [Acidobacteriota bacterium]
MKPKNIFVAFLAAMSITLFIAGLCLGKEKRPSIIDLDPTAMEFRELINENPQDAVLLSDYATYCARKGWYRESLKYYRKALQIRRKDHILHTNIGSVLVRMGKNSAAASAFKKAISIEPNYAIAHYNLGAIYDAQQKYDAAIKEYKRALILDPSLANASINPLIVNNAHLTVLNMLIYNEKEGALSLPLQEIKEE